MITEPEGREVVAPWRLLRSVGLVDEEQEGENHFVARVAVDNGDAAEARVVGCRLHTVRLGAGRVVATSEWLGTAKGGHKLRRLDGTKVGNLFGCFHPRGSNEYPVAEEELRWVPLLAGEWKQLKPGHKVATEGQRQWRKLLEKVNDMEYKVSYLCRGKVRYETMRIEEAVAVKVERLPVHSIDSVGACVGQHGGQKQGDSIWILDSRGERSHVRRLEGDEIWRLHGLPP